MATEGFDALVDRLMYCDGLDRTEAEAEAERRLENLAEAVFSVDPCDCGDHCDPGDCACGMGLA